MLNNTQKDLLASIIVGDGGIYKDNKYNSYYISFAHGKQQKDYCEWKMKLLNSSDIFDTKIIMHTKMINLNGKKFVQYNVKKCGYCLKFLYDKFIIDKKKTVYEILPMMRTKQAVAIWFMDDGNVEEGHWKDKSGNKHVTRPNIKLCTHSFSYEEHLFIQKWFKDKFNLNCKIKEEKKKEKVYYYLRFPVIDAEKLYREILMPYINCCKSMRYKFRHCIEYYK